MDTNAVLLDIGDGDYLRYNGGSGTISNVICGASGNTVGVFTVAINPDDPPLTLAEAEAIASEWRRDKQERQRHVEAVGAEIPARAAANRERFFHD